MKHLKCTGMKFPIYVTVLITCILVSTGCARSSVDALWACSGSQADSFGCSLARARVKEDILVKKMNDICYYNSNASEDSRECRKAQYELDLERHGSKDKKKAPPAENLMTSKNIIAVGDDNYESFVTKSENQEWVVLRGKGGNFTEIKNINTGEKRFWYGDNHEDSHIRAISNDGKLVAYLYGGLDTKNSKEKYSVVLQDIVENKVLSRVKLEVFPKFILISPKKQFLAISYNNEVKVPGFFTHPDDSNNVGINIFALKQGSDTLKLLKTVFMGDVQYKQVTADFQFSSDESRFLTINRKKGLNVYDIKSGFSLMPSKIVLEKRLNSADKTVSYSTDEVANATFLEQTNKLVILLETLIFRDPKGETYGTMLRRNLTVAIEQHDGSIISTAIGTEPFDAWPDRYSLISSGDGRYVMFNRQDEFEFHFLHLGSTGRIEKQTKCCVDNATVSDTAIDFKRNKLPSSTINGVYINSNNFFKVFLTDPKVVYFPLVIEAGKWKRVAEW